MEQSLSSLMTSHFTRLSEKYSTDQIERSGWSSKETQLRRFQVLSDIILPTSSVMDVGCGVGDFYGHLLQNGFTGYYCGVDLISSNCEQAAKRYAGASFLNSDILSLPTDMQFDFVVASGIFFINSADWESAVVEIIGKIHQHSLKAFAVNFLSIYAPEKKDGLYYADPNFIIEIISRLSRKFVLRHDYAENDNDFSIIVNKA
jgi:SAM-dependent methyltransferase